MAASDSMPVPRKNTAFRLYFDLRTAAGALVTTWAGADSERSIDGGSFADCTNEATEIGTSGVGYIDLTAAEMNGDCVIVKTTVTNTGAVTAVFYLYPQEAGDIRVNATYFNGALLTSNYSVPPTVEEIAETVGGGGGGDVLENEVPGAYAVGSAGYQLARIGSAGATVISPVAAGGAVTIYQNATYSMARGTALVWTLTTSIVLTGGTVTMDAAGVSYAGSISGSSGAWVITVQLTAAQTAAMALGVTRYDLSAIVSGDALPPLATGTLTVLKNV